ncbi:MAG: uroporphyrinogen decarboxylase [Actinomycetota bacterium]|nr:uroporphyrinogen decarboxylase [Actinomycetota bacterium]
MHPDQPVFLRACRSLPVERVPVWFMRQAGRSLPEFRALRGTSSVLDAIARPELAAELTLQPVRRYGVDAAILFSDIVTPLAAIGVGVDVVAGRGPVVSRPFRSASDIARLRVPDAAGDLAHVAEAARIVAAELGDAVPLIGFCGGPFTLACYLVEGGASRDFRRTKALMWEEPDLWAQLTRALADIAVEFLQVQVAAGARAVQIFDSWAGLLAPAAYAAHVLPAAGRIFDGLAASGVPRIHFGVGTGEILPLMAAAGADVVGVDWRVPLAGARRRLGTGIAVQGNLDPVACLAPWPVVAAEATAVLDDAGDEPGHIFNLGHGVLPETDPGILAEIVGLVHERRSRDA